MERYEVFPVEPLHDLKGNFSHIVEETLKVAPVEVTSVINHINETVLDKSTLRASNYSKAIILIYSSLLQHGNPRERYVKLFRTAAEIAQIMYAPDSQRSPTTILRLHNATFIHGMLCRGETSGHSSVLKGTFTP